MLKILLLEDNDNDAFLAIRAVRGLATVERVSSREQFQSALSRPWDVILLDFSLPQLVGDEALKLALERAPQTPAIVLSGTITVEKAVETIKAGATDYIEKGNWPLLPVAVDRALREQRDKLQLLRAQRMEDIGALASGIAHDLNNAIAPTVLALDMLSAGLSEENRRLVAMAKQGVQREAEMLQQILRFVRGSNGVHRTVALRELLEQLLDFLRHTFPKSIQVRHNIASNLPTVAGNSTQLHQVVLNLCINARDALLGVPPSGGPQPVLDLTAGVSELSDHRTFTEPDTPISGRFVQISVADNGPGMELHIATRIFAPFFTTKKAGTGLGLSNVLKIVREHHGHIDLKTIPGIGSKFSVLLPAQGAPSTINPQPSTPALPTGRGRTLLLVDDEDGLRDLTKSLLESYDYRVLDAATGTEALALYRDHADEIAVVITDMMMPGIGGVELIGLLRQIEAEVKVICITGQGSAEAAAAKPDAALGKPFTAEQLLTKLAQLVES